MYAWMSRHLHDNIKAHLTHGVGMATLTWIDKPTSTLLILYHWTINNCYTWYNICITKIFECFSLFGMHEMKAYEIIVINMVVYIQGLGQGHVHHEAPLIIIILNVVLLLIDNDTLYKDNFAQLHGFIVTFTISSK